MAEHETVAVVGGGSWATALVWLLTQNGHTVHWWLRSAESRTHLAATGRNPRYLPQVQLPLDQLALPEHLPNAFAGATRTLLAVPSAYVEATLAQVPPAAVQAAAVGSAIKGLVPSTGERISDYCQRVWGLPPEAYTVVTGPSHAEEVVRGQLTFLTCGSVSAAQANGWAACLASPTVVTVGSDDVEGLEFSGVLKNVYALAVGLALGLGYGDNFRAVLASACIRELETYLAQAHPNPARVVTDSAYLGDLLVTAYSEHSRNRQLGYRVGAGQTPAEALAHMGMIAEGYSVVRVLIEVLGLTNLPIAQAVYNVVHQGLPPQKALLDLAPTFR